MKEIEKVSVSKTEYERYKKWSQGITLKEFREEVEKLGLTIEEDSSLNWNIKIGGCKVASIDPINECVMQTSGRFYIFHFKCELFALLTNLAYTCREDRHIEDFFEEDDINED